MDNENLGSYFQSLSLGLPIFELEMLLP